MVKNKKILLNVDICATENIKPEFWFINEKLSIKQWTELTNKIEAREDMVYIEFFKDKKCGVRAELIFNRSFSEMVSKPLTKKSRKEFSKEVQKALDDDKPVDTSKWVKPNDEVLTNELIKYLLLCEILVEGSEKFIEAEAKARVLYSILHTTSPSHDFMVLTNYAITPYFEHALRHALKGFNIIERRKKVKTRQGFQQYKKRWLKKMIVKSKFSRKRNFQEEK